MKNSWKTLRTIIQENGDRKDLLLTLIDEEGKIFSANRNMLNTLHLGDIKSSPVNLFNLLHPFNINEFILGLQNCDTDNNSFSAELFLKNGYYHPMKWQVNFLEKNEDKKKVYLCTGYKLLDDERLEEFNRLGEENYQSIVEGLNAGILFQDKRGELITANQKAAEVFGTTLERLYQLKNIAYLWDNQWQVTNEQGIKVNFCDTPFMKALQTGLHQQQILSVVLREGENRWIEFNSQPLFEQDSSIPYSVVTGITDISKQKKLIVEIDKRKALFEAFMNNTPNIAWVIDESERLVFANSAFYQYFKLDQMETLDKPLTTLVPIYIYKALYDKHKQVLETGKPIDVIEKVKWATGSNLVFHINMFPVSGPSGEKLVGGHAVNMAEKYAVEKQLREANERLLLLSRATNDAIWEWDMQTGKMFRNDALMDMIGYGQEATRGLSWWLRRIHPDDRNRVSDKVKDTTEKGLHSWEDRYRFKCADGNFKFMQDKGFVVYENGLPVKMIGSLQDVSELKELENQLTEEKLQRQKEISETVIRVQEKERTRIGHELHDNVNQILSTVRLFVDMLKPADKEGKEIKARSLEYVMMAIEEIRKLSKELVAPQLIGNGLVNSIQSVVEDINVARAIRINFYHDRATYPISPGKKLTFFRIVQEQIKNILKYSKATKANIRLTCDTTSVTLTISDDGIGFNPEETRRGIGLSNIYERTRFYNGIAGIDTSPGKGCQLTITLPIL